MPLVATTIGALVPDALTSRSSQPSKPSPLTNTSLASATFLASPGEGAYTWALPLGPTKVATSTRSPPTFFMKSPRIEKLAMTLSRSCARAQGATKSAASAVAASACRRVSMAPSSAACDSSSCFEVAAGEGLSHQTADAAEQQRAEIERAGDQNDRGAGRDPGVKGEEQAGAARDHAARGGDQNHQRGVAGPEAADRRRQHHDADREQGAERVEAAHQVDHHEYEERQVRRTAGGADRAHEAGIDAFDHQRPVDQRQHDQGDGGIGGDQQQRLIIEREHVAEQHVQ